ncbi:MAG: hypothetical protein QXF12_02185 [Candidatus Aenigmatarchaeota archaeon]
MEMLKHTGQVINTGKRCVILLLELPERPGYCLIAETDSLPERIHDPLMNILKSNEAQNAKNLLEVLYRRIMPDTGRNFLLELHNLGYLRAEPADNIYIMPRNNIRVKASDVIRELKKIEGIKENEVNYTETVSSETVEKNLNLYEENLNVSDSEKNIEIAKNILIQAKMLEEDAKRLREKAYKLAPSLFNKEEAKEYSEIREVVVEKNEAINKDNEKSERKVRKPAQKVDKNNLSTNSSSS